MRTETQSKRPKRRRDPAIAGIGVSTGIAIGPAHVLEGGIGQVPEYEILASAVDAEVQRFRDGLVKARKQVRKLRRKVDDLPGGVQEELGALLEAHLTMMDSSRLIGGVEAIIAERRINAEAALQSTVSEIARTLSAVPDRYLASRAQDIREVGDRVLRQLTDTPYQAFSRLQPGSIVVAEELSPADTALMSPEQVSGFVTALGGSDSHTAIMARSMGLPAVLGVTEIAARVKSGDMVIIDGDAGLVLVAPDEATIAEYRRKAEAKERLDRKLAELRSIPGETADGVRISLMANMELPRDVEAADRAGAEGIGLLRTEFLFMNRPDLPDEDEQYAILRGIVDAMGGRPVTIRTIDLGGEKLATALGDRIADSPNPALGLRAIRLMLQEPRLMDAQLGAILRAGAHGPVRILLPMITSTEQVRQVREAIQRTARRLKRKKIKIANPLPPLGAMIEVPGAALTADALARECDFLAIGTNDLTMYTLAIDRGDEQVAALYNPLHPSVLRLVQFSVEAALRQGIPISLCGEIAGDPRYAPLLLGLGVKELSMSAPSLPRVKQRIRRVALGAATHRAHAIMDQTDEARISTLLDDFNAGLMS